jgi:hypothetical protein
VLPYGLAEILLRRPRVLASSRDAETNRPSIRKREVVPETDATHGHRAASSADTGAHRHPSHPSGSRFYERHRPEETVLYKTVQAHWKTFLSELESAAEPPVLPRS